MKIAIDCADLDHSRIDGTRVYIKNLLEYFGQSRNDQFFLYHQTEFSPLLKPANFSNYIDRKIPYKPWWTQTRLAYEVLKEKPEALWMPIQQMPALVKGRIKTVVTIHDLAFKIFPGHFTAGDRLKLNLFTDLAVKNADKIMAVSNSTKNDILKFYPSIKETKIKVVYHGFDRQLFGKKYSVQEIAPVLAKYQILPKLASCQLAATPYLLYVGAIQPRKDLITLVQAFEGLKTKRRNRNLKLVLVGSPAWKAEETLAKIKNSANKEDIILAGKVGFEELAKIYQGAQAFVLPALYEGFGMPILEAFASGVPVVVADNSSLAEVGFQAVLRFPTQDAQALAEILQKLLESDSLRLDLIAKGQKRLKDFSWEKCAQETLESLKSV